MHQSCCLLLPPSFCRMPFLGPDPAPTSHPKFAMGSLHQPGWLEGQSSFLCLSAHLQCRHNSIPSHPSPGQCNSFGGTSRTSSMAVHCVVAPFACICFLQANTCPGLAYNKSKQREGRLGAESVLSATEPSCWLWRMLAQGSWQQRIVTSWDRWNKMKRRWAQNCLKDRVTPGATTLENWGGKADRTKPGQNTLQLDWPSPGPVASLGTCPCWEQLWGRGTGLLP